MTATERRELRAVARRYEREGYSVRTPEDAASAPAFLGGFIPDLVAEREDDHVVVEIRSARAVPGSNDLVELAERVAGQPGWRLELIALAETSMPSHRFTSRDRDDVEHLLEAGFVRPAFAVAYMAVENAAVALAAHYKLKVRDRSTGSIFRQLAASGVVSTATYRDFGRLSSERHALVHGVGNPQPSPDDVRSMLRLRAVLDAEIEAAEAA